jgi:uncharacterized protein YkwD
MKTQLFLSLVLFPILSFSQSRTSEEYLIKEFKTLVIQESLRQPIDFKNIDYPLLYATIFVLTNEEREKNGLNPLQFSKEAENSAAGHAQDMVKYSFYSHTSPIRFKRTLRDRINRSGLNPKYLGENICSTFGLQYEPGKKVGKPQNPGEFHYLNASNNERIPPHTYLSLGKSVIRLWMESPTHRKNILNPAFTHLGCGAEVYFEKSFYGMPYFMAVQNFLTR